MHANPTVGAWPLNVVLRSKNGDQPLSLTHPNLMP